MVSHLPTNTKNDLANKSVNIANAKTAITALINTKVNTTSTKLSGESAAEQLPCYTFNTEIGLFNIATFFESVAAHGSINIHYTRHVTMVNILTLLAFDNTPESTPLVSVADQSNSIEMGALYYANPIESGADHILSKTHREQALLAFSSTATSAIATEGGGPATTAVTQGHVPSPVVWLSSGTGTTRRSSPHRP